MRYGPADELIAHPMQSLGKCFGRKTRYAGGDAAFIRRLAMAVPQKGGFLPFAGLYADTRVGPHVPPIIIRL